MAILKHRSSKNSNYNDIIDYLIYEHNEATNTPVLDENGDLSPRKEYILGGINCSPETFAVECRELNRQWGKNQEKNDVKSHQYILSFDPKDVEDHGLTGEKVQELAMDFAARNFPGHQILVCTHMDGHNGSGNIHAHIVLNSVRKFDVPEGSGCYASQPSDLKAGGKHHQTKESLEFLKADVMEMCRRNGLYQVDLLDRAARKESEREYFAGRNGQRKIDREAAETGKEPGRFQTQKEELREAIAEAAQKAKNMDEFAGFLADQYQILVSVTRGQITYRHPDRQKNIRGRTLGAACELEYLNGVFALNRGQGRDDSRWDSRAGSDRYHEPHEYDRKHNYVQDPVTVLYIRSRIRLVIDLQDETKAVLEARALLQEIGKEKTGRYDVDAVRQLKEQISGREEKARLLCGDLTQDLLSCDERLEQEMHVSEPNDTKVSRLRRERKETESRLNRARTELRYCKSLQHQIDVQSEAGFGETLSSDDLSKSIANLRMAARTIIWTQEHGYSDRGELQNALNHISVERQRSQEKYDSAKSSLQEVRDEITLMGRYLSSKKIYDEFLRSDDKGLFRNRHKQEIDEYEDAVKQLRAIHGEDKFSTISDLRMRRADLQAEKDKCYSELKYYRDQERDMDTISANIDTILGDEGAGKERMPEQEMTEPAEHPDLADQKKSK